MSVGSVNTTNSSNSTSGTSSSSSSNASYNLTTQDFIQMMVTQLENQDPLNPTDSQALLAQESSIGQLEAATDTQTTMQSLTLQTQIGSASSLIGRSVTGIDGNNNSVNGTVSSVQVSSGNVSLQLDNGSTLSLSNVSSIDGTDSDSSTSN